MHALDRDEISFIARRTDRETFVLDQRPKKVIEKSSGLRSMMASTWQWFRSSAGLAGDLSSY
jgi:hypothetical protein